MPAGRPPKDLPDSATLRVLREGGWLLKHLWEYFGVSRTTLKRRLKDQTLGILDPRPRCTGDSPQVNLAAILVSPAPPAAGLSPGPRCDVQDGSTPGHRSPP